MKTILWELSCFFWSTFACCSHESDYERVAHSLNKSVDELAQPNGKRNLSDKKEHKIISKLTSATHILPVLTFPLSLGFAAGNLV